VDRPQQAVRARRLR